MDIGSIGGVLQPHSVAKASSPVILSIFALGAIELGTERVVPSRETTVFLDCHVRAPPFYSDKDAVESTDDHGL